VLSHRYEFEDAEEALLSVLALPNGTTMSSTETVSLTATEICGVDVVDEADGVE
jgi:hypothetical protein